MRIRLLLAAGVVSLAAFGLAQDRLPSYPGYAHYQEMLGKRGSAITYGRETVRWADDGFSLNADHDGKLQRFDVKARVWGPATTDVSPGPSPRSRRSGRPSRGRQFDNVLSSDGVWKGFVKDRNVFLGKADGTESVQVTKDGSAEKRIKYGVASWVYGEELDQTEALWMSPDGSKLAFYRFDESKVPDYYITLNEGSIQDALDVEAYPKPGAPNPVADVCVYDRTSGKTLTIDARFGDPELGHYVYNVQWTPDGKELMFFRQNRKQNHMQVCVANPATGACRVVVDEANPAGWVPYRPGSFWSQSGTVPIFLAPQEGAPQRFVWVSERDGFRNAYLYDLTGRLIVQLTKNPFDLQELVGLNENAGWLWYTSHDGDVPTKVQLHRVKLDGTSDQLLTDRTLSHRITLAPKTGFFSDVAESIETPPQTRLCDPTGAIVEVLATSNVEKFKAAGFQPVERVTFKAADGKTDLYGWISKPSDFDPSKKYPLLVDVYGGPEMGTVQESYQMPNQFAELGFIVAWFDGRGSWGRGRDFRQAVYRQLGIVEIDDQAAGVKALEERPYIDRNHVGIFGTSYGGYASVMALLRYPDVFQAASASSPVTDWRNYDSTYTERYMDIPQDNDAGYQAGSARTWVKNLKGRLLLYYGTADNNVHVSNSLQLIRALADYNKSYELAVGPDQGHSGVDASRMMEFFIQHLVLGQ